MKERILVAGIGNIFFGDDAFGVEVARRLADALPSEVASEVRVRDFGIRSYDLAFALQEGYETVIFVDAMPRGGTPGTLYTLEPDWRELSETVAGFDGHRLDPASVLRLVGQMGGTSSEVLVVGCEPGSLGEEEDGRMGLSAAVEAAVDEAVKMIQALVARLLSESTQGNDANPESSDLDLARKINGGG